MTSVSISELKANPSAVLSAADDYPISIKKRNKTAGYVVGKDIFEKLVTFVEDYIDKKAIEDADYTRGTSLDDFVKELGLE
ncbi:hypothetical protein A2962_00645 [Candidatus Woesebacteria bacterium RIFCSPLOWO2_01_FULL_39_61]|uniref:Uncharacterized protein n=1 Tax=Candidatus Woesebacteria bacterium RIFCSPHIGHO2_02_FULL_39_13 TaxID=1802505 RepID=A0A1F7Z1T6_9BACT|nr:MAG: hypothetical protein A2692_04775 [Candidatus Woesebacteria bacterium RIFCSPHIGHO2_01_FULL_39_95]OGM33583.1 MAG: hypothetical protein A3D01_01350 [Candidatus Woesebacteria bacterium RIFCSPHIGHO2_02_FULL_39_13]OGM36687.1 MAG: hypothetical protein A3E13_00140 [Candidatus Woesebacteria bacterium RIFCSPHIGHO2_12_FULL_40_20]OGM68560.1 MAG: hypothetical protein A2962_00645 [Candidatus Woesebacteria bacterium RIFCSPLOWO2_01_FULL_39_61]OGM75031.1 MAG: hypothetical protein A3H19_02100 [Candidatus